MKELGKIKEVNLRDVWPHEADHFTPWLADNLGLLGEALEMELVFVEREAAVGGFSLDILARDRATGQLVAIENQLEWTDHTHLGQLLTYAAGRDARAMVWVSPSFREEHRAAIDWLNRWTPPEIGFWGVEVRAIKIGDSHPAPEFRLVAFPNDWVREKQRGDASPEQGKMRQFLTELKSQLRQKGFYGNVRKDGDGIIRYYSPSKFTGIQYSLELSDRAFAYIWVVAENAAAKHEIFSALENNEPQLEKEIDAKWYWSSRGNARYDSLGISTEGSIDDPPEKLEQHKAWLLEHLLKLKDVLHPRLERIMDEAPGEASP